MNLFNLTAKITLDTSEYEKGIKNAKDTIDSAKKSTDDYSDSTKKNIGVIAKNAWLQIAKEVINLGLKMKDLTLDMVNYADKYGDLSKKYDISSKSLQEFEYIGTQTGATLESLISAMTMMYNRAKEDDEVFGKLGISVRDTNGNMKTMEDLFWETKSAIDQVTNSGDQSALMLEAFGRNAMSVGEFLRTDTKELKALQKEANDLGIILSDEVVESAGKVNDTLDRMKLVGKSAFAELLLGGDGAEEKFNDFINQVMQLLEENLPKILKGATRALEIIIKGLAEALPDIIPILIESFMSVNWLEVGFNIAKAIIKGIVTIFSQGLPALLGFGKKEENVSRETSDIEILPRNSINETTTNTNKNVKLEVTTKGDTKIDEENAELIAKKLVPYIDQNMGVV